MKITIITATYNSASTIRNTFDSVLIQTYADIEYWVIDGASKDGTVDIIKEYQGKFDGRLYYISEPDHGIYDAMNKGIKMSTGDIIGILNSDDFYSSENVLSMIVSTFKKRKELQAVYGDVHYVHPNNIDKCVRYYSSKIFCKALMRVGFMPAHPSFYVKRICYENFGLYNEDYKICADFELLLRFIYLRNITIKYLPLDMVTMRTGGVSTCGFASHVQIMKEHLRAFRSNNVYTNVILLSLRYIYKFVELFLVRRS